ncbi:MAG: hypothetical protein Q4D38_10260 [Planctomycetia bacterium]|nr:hypothetical protein [Planctomycetia bacterium]
MATTTERIDVDLIRKIVRNIVDELAAEPTRRASRPGGGAPSDSVAVAEFALLKNVVTLSDLSQIPPRTRRLALLPTALLTPAARDELEERKIEIRRSVSAADNKKQTLNLVDIYAIRTSFNPQALLPALHRFGFAAGEVSDEKQDFAALRREMERVGRNAVVLTSETDEALCLLNRSEKICAVRLAPTSDISRLKRNLSPNVLVINPAETNVFLAGKLIAVAFLD